MIAWAISAASILGAILNAFGKVLGFYVWIVANLAWVAYGIYYQDYAQIPMWLTYSAISVIGIIVWRRKRIK